MTAARCGSRWAPAAAACSAGLARVAAGAARLRRGCQRLWRDDVGGVAAEFAVTLPAVLLVLAAAVGILNAQAQRVVLQDAAADAARLLARGDDPQRAASVVAAAVPGARLEVDIDADLVCVDATAALRVVADLPVDLHARSCALGGGR